MQAPASTQARGRGGASEAKDPASGRIAMATNP